MTETRPDDVAAIKSVLQQSYKAWEAGDAEAFVTDYAEDATVVMPGIYKRSREEIRQSMAESFASFLKGTSAVDKMESIRFLGEDTAVAVSEAGIRFPGETEVPADRKVYATWVFAKRDGNWLVAAYSNSPAVMPS
ncbi:MAG: SgcJ/EcaC family oxidoreductase [Trebonia sp.]